MERTLQRMAPPKGTAPGGGAAIAVLVADPDPLFRDAVELYFHGHTRIQATTVDSTAAALKMLATAHVDAVILDATMPGTLELCTQLRSSSTAVVALAPLTDTTALEQLPPEAAPLLLPKPISMRALERALVFSVHTSWLERQVTQLQQTASYHREQDRHYQELKRQLIQLTEQIEQRDRRFRTAIHDMQNPIANLSALLKELHSRREQLPPLAKDNVELCVQSVDLLQSLVEDILSATYLDSSPALERRQLDVAHLLRSCARRFTATAEQKNIWINVLVPSTLPPLDADEHHLTKALDNLISNAIKYTNPGGSVTLEAEYQSDTMLIHVRDTGVGLTADDIANAFGEFKRLSSVPTAGEPSTGLGLYIVRRIAELHGGSVHATSPGKGYGSTFTIALPLQSSGQR